MAAVALALGPAQLPAVGVGLPADVGRVGAHTDTHLCTEVSIVGVRGSSEAGPGSPGYVPPSGPVTEQSLARSFGRPVANVIWNLAPAAPSQRWSSSARSITYSALPVSRLFARSQTYVSSIREGVGATMQFLSQTARDCPDERLVLVGYSQGAMVLHRVLQALDPRDTRILPRIDAALLIADGDRLNRDTADVVGSVGSRTRGIAQYAPSISAASGQRLSPSLGRRVTQVCRRNDPVCDATGLLADLWWLRVHLSYPGSAELREATSRARAALLATPIVRSATVVASVGVPLSHRLVALVHPRYSVEYRLAAGQQLPAGLSLSSAGTISGTPLAPGRATVTVDVRSRRLGETGRWVQAHVRVAVAG